MQDYSQLSKYFYRFFEDYICVDDGCSAPCFLWSIQVISFWFGTQLAKYSLYGQIVLSRTTEKRARCDRTWPAFCTFGVVITTVSTGPSGLSVSRSRSPYNRFQVSTPLSLQMVCQTGISAYQLLPVLLVPLLGAPQQLHQIKLKIFWQSL